MLFLVHIRFVFELTLLLIYFVWKPPIAWNCRGVRFCLSNVSIWVSESICGDRFSFEKPWNVKPHTLLEEMLIQLLDRRELKTSLHLIKQDFVKWWQLCRVFGLLLTVLLPHCECVSWSKVVNSNHNIKPAFLVLSVIATSALVRSPRDKIKSPIAAPPLLMPGPSWQDLKGRCPEEWGEAEAKRAPVNVTLRHAGGRVSCVVLVRGKEDDLEVDTCSGTHLAPEAVEQDPSLIFHSAAYVGAISSPAATLIAAYLFMSSPCAAN